MANFRKGILGGFSGKVGTVIGGNWKGIDYMRSLSSGRNSQLSPAQLAQTAKFSLAIQFVQSMSGLVKITYHNFAQKMTEFNNAVSYTLKHAITGSFPAFSISYPDVLVSRGDLPNATAPAVTASPDSIITYNWVNNSGTGIAKSTDMAILVAYEPLSNTMVYSTGPARDALTGTLNLLAFQGKNVQTYIGFISGNGKEVANSIYTGELLVS